ncbi:hypothetical protein F4825DRAFT_449724 [Nemania diffusa]|nr:hypothetical protein F4825DRAFT_449724 [Nemania diffusa]
MPLEVLLQITSYLTTPDYGHLRGTCKQLEALLFRAFSREFFSKRQFALVEFSIQTLVDIAKSRLGPSLTHLIIHVEHPYFNPVSLGFRFGPMHRSPRGPPEINRLHAECINHTEFVTTGLDAEMLSDALKHLPNLETIGMRDFRSESRHRDDTTWNSYGCPTFVAAIGTGHCLQIPIGKQDHGPEYVSHVFLTILRAIGNAALSGGNPELTRIEVLLRYCQFPDHSFKIPTRFDSAVSMALSKLKTLLLEGLTQEGTHLFAVDDGNGKEIGGSGYFLSRFLPKASGLEHLRLNFRLYQRAATERVLLWLAGKRDDPADVAENPSGLLTFVDGSLPPHFPPAPKFPNLQHLEIGMATVTESVLLALYQNYASTLRGISLHKVTLEGKASSNINLWTRLCSKMARANLEINRLRLSYMRQKSLDHYALGTGQVTFQGSKNEFVRSWAGSAFSQAIKDINGEMKLSWDSDNSNEDDDDLMDDEDDDEDEDEDDDDDDEGGGEEYDSTSTEELTI